MAWTAPVDPTGGTIITVSYFVTNALDNLRWLRLLTGNADPPGSSYVVVSDSTTGTTWRKIPTDAIADGAVTAAKLGTGAVVSHLGYTPFNAAGGTIVKNTGAVDGNLYTRANAVVNTSDGSRPAIAFSRDGTGAIALYYESGTTLHIITNGGTDVTVLTSASTTIDAATLDGHDSGNAANDIPISNGTVCTSLNAEKVGGFIHSDFVKIASPGATQTVTSPGSTSTTFGTYNIAGHNLSGLGVVGDFTASGQKNRAATGHDGVIGIFHSFETPLPMFADLARDHLTDGVAIVPIPADLANYLDLTSYHVFLSADGPAALYANPAEMTPEQFVVRAKVGDPDVGFGWFLIARQGDMGHVERVLPLKETA